MAAPSPVTAGHSTASEPVTASSTPAEMNPVDVEEVQGVLPDKETVRKIRGLLEQAEPRVLEFYSFITREILIKAFWGFQACALSPGPKTP